MAEGVAEATAPANGASAHYEARRLVKMERLKEAVGSLTGQRDAAQSEVARLTKENEALQRKTDSSALAKQNAELQGKLRTLEHRKTFDRLAAEKGVTSPKAQDLLYKESGWKADADEFDEAEMSATIDASLTEMPFLKGAEATQDEGQQPIVKPGPGSGQAATAGKKRNPREGDHLIIPDNDPRLIDTSWQASAAGQAAMMASAQEKMRRGMI
jgi:hypothetical protein